MLLCIIGVFRIVYCLAYHIRIKVIVKRFSIFLLFISVFNCLFKYFFVVENELFPIFFILDGLEYMCDAWNTFLLSLSLSLPPTSFLSLHYFLFFFSLSYFHLSFFLVAIDRPPWLPVVYYILNVLFENILDYVFFF